MKKRPILFSSPMVRALLAGRKTQTRRLVKPQPVPAHGTPLFPGVPVAQGDWFWQSPEVPQSVTVSCKPNGPAGWAEDHSPFGQPGDRLWVKETIRLAPDQAPDNGTEPVRSIYAADGAATAADAWPWKRPQLNSIHCPRGLSRIELEITGVRIERLHALSRVDAAAEGICYPDSEAKPAWYRNTSWPEENFAGLWEAINGLGSWAANPWVWVVEFRRLP